MSRTNWKKIAEEFLDEQWNIIQMLRKRGEESKPNENYYEGAIRAVECLGYWWKRTEGKHTIGKN